ncbi:MULTISPECIES: hypothetical protein [unclassified Bradyrhizobium]|uniref:hypothetical protein n=1 Tax=unclassified Bradyrhizobium TaxID=2631580 RepID=UPI001CD61ABB|nr:MULTISPECIES: hypothetical protein [unclassified Bradyrhizobium]MCA1378586.1 hypothetical protein [Bradyrhizobium sp. IC4060]MCA1488561.1 hypothetical protein [Bradyrhizobium sp. IC4061]
MHLRSSTLQMRKKHEASCDGSKSDSFVNGRPSRANQAGRQIRLFLHLESRRRPVLALDNDFDERRISLTGSKIGPVPAEAAALTRA